jgi:hypothetical protein
MDQSTRERAQIESIIYSAKDGADILKEEEKDFDTGSNYLADMLNGNALAANGPILSMEGPKEYPEGVPYVSDEIYSRFFDMLKNYFVEMGEKNFNNVRRMELDFASYSERALSGAADSVDLKRNFSSLFVATRLLINDIFGKYNIERNKRRRLKDRAIEFLMNMSRKIYLSSDISREVERQIKRELNEPDEEDDNGPYITEHQTRNDSL